MKEKPMKRRYKVLLSEDAMHSYGIILCVIETKSQTMQA